MPPSRSTHTKTVVVSSSFLPQEKLSLPRDEGAVIDCPLSRLRLTSDELASERYCVVDAEASLCADGKAVLLLVESNVADFVGAHRALLSH